MSLHNETRRRPGRVVAWAIAAMLLGGIVMYGGWVAVNGVPGVNEARAQRLVEARADTRPSPSAGAERTRAVTRSKAPEPKRIARTVPEVLRTSFVPEYRNQQPKIAGWQFRETYHPDADLAADGLDICRMMGDDSITLTDMIEDFTTNDHPHKGPVTPKAAMQTYRLAQRTLCPDLGDAFEAKRP